MQNPNITIFAFQVLGETGCLTNYIGNYNGARYAPKYILAFNAEVTDLYNKRYSVPNPGFFSGQPQFVNLAARDGTIFAANYKAAGMTSHLLNGFGAITDCIYFQVDISNPNSSSLVSERNSATSHYFIIQVLIIK